MIIFIIKIEIIIKLMYNFNDLFFFQWSYLNFGWHMFPKKKKKDDKPILDLKKSDLTTEEQQFFIIALGLMAIIML